MRIHREFTAWKRRSVYRGLEIRVVRFREWEPDRRQQDRRQQSLEVAELSALRIIDFGENHSASLGL